MKTTRSVKCQEPGCNEYGHFVYDTQKEARERSKFRETWKCSRHTKPDNVLSTTNTERKTILIAGKSIRYPNLPDLFWSQGSGHISGPGFKAWANDFPEGTQIEITARVILPS